MIQEIYRYFISYKYNGGAGRCAMETTYKVSPQNVMDIIDMWEKAIKKHNGYDAVITHYQYVGALYEGVK